MESEAPGSEAVRNEEFQNLDNATPLDLNSMDEYVSAFLPYDLDYDKTGAVKTNQNERKKRERKTESEVRESARRRNLERARKLRSDPGFREREKLRKRKSRLDPIYRQAENERNRLQKRMARMNPIYRDAERKRNTRQKRKAREDPTFRVKERINRLGREGKIPWNLSEEWLQIGPVQIDAEAQVALEQGLYKVAPDDKNNPPEEELSSWTPEEKDLLTKLCYSSQSSDSSKNSESSPSVEESNKIDHDENVKMNLVSAITSDDSKPVKINSNIIDNLEGNNSLYDPNNFLNISQHRHFLDVNDDTVAEKIHKNSKKKKKKLN